jgi:protein TonB
MRIAVAYLVSGLLHAGLLGWLSVYADEAAEPLAIHRGPAAVSLAAAFREPAARSERATEVELAPEPTRSVSEVEKRSPGLDADRLPEVVAVVPAEAVPAEASPSPAFERAEVLDAAPGSVAVESWQAALARVPGAAEIATQAADAEEGAGADTASSSASAGADVDELPVPVESNRPPRYPAGDLAAGRQGLVLLRVGVSSEGTVRSIRVARTSSVRSLDMAALDAVEQWRFRPAQRGGAAVPCSVLVPIRFKYQGSGQRGDEGMRG